MRSGRPSSASELVGIVALLVLLVPALPSALAAGPHPETPSGGSVAATARASSIGTVGGGWPLPNRVVPALCVWNHLRAPQGHAVLPESSGNDSETNRYIANWSGEGDMAEDPAQPLHLIAVGQDDLYAAENNTTAFNEWGTEGVFTSEDGGRTWADRFLPPSPQWFNNSSSVCDQLAVSNAAVAFGPNGSAYMVSLAQLAPGDTPDARCRKWASWRTCGRPTTAGRPGGLPVPATPIVARVHGRQAVDRRGPALGRGVRRV